MTSCREARQWILQYFEGELQPEQMRPLQNHLACCEACMIIYRSAREIVTQYFTTQRSERRKDVAVPC